MALAPADNKDVLDCLTQHFSLDELFTLVVLLGVAPHTFHPYPMESFCLDLIAYVERRERTSDLIHAILDARPFLSARLAHLVPAVISPFSSPSLSLPLVPAPNPLFTGREREWATLDHVLLTEGGDVAITGTGGRGKTQLASEWMHRHAHHFTGGVFWFSFADAEAVAGQVAAHAARLRPGAEGLPFAEQVGLVQRAWQEPTPRLLVFDNCEEVALFEQWRPTTGGSRVLLTSRRAAWSAVAGLHAVPLGVLPNAQSVALLTAFRPDLKGDARLGQIAVRLGNLPLALHLAGSYLKRYRHSATLGSPEAYLKALARPDLLAHPSLQGADDPATGDNPALERTIALSYEQLDPHDKVDAVALTLLTHAACLAPDEPIPHDLLVRTLPTDGSNEEEAARCAEDALHRLHDDLGLIELQEETGAVVLHPLFAAFVIKRRPLAAPDQVEQALLTESQRLLREGYPLALRPLQPHLRHLAEAALQHPDQRTADLGDMLGVLLTRQGEYGTARSYLEGALAIRERVLGGEHPDTASSLDHLGRLQERQGQYSTAHAPLVRALAIREKTQGAEHRDTASSLDTLGRLLTSGGEYKRARAYLERALAVREKLLGTEHPDTATTLHNLGVLLENQGKVIPARSYLARALAIREKTLGREHPDTASSLHSLSSLLCREGQTAEARPYLERALAIREKVLGPEHPHTAATLNLLGALLERQGTYPAALAAHERALAIRERVLGAEHPDTATSLHDLGLLRERQGEYEEARTYLEKALAIRQKVLGNEHPDTATSFNSLGWLLDGLGESVEARVSYERALEIREKVLGVEHRDTASSLYNLGALLESQAAHTLARTYYERALEIREQELGAGHADTMSSLHTLVNLLARQGEYEAARAHPERVLALWEASLGSEHPDLVAPLTLLGWLLARQGKPSEARAYYERVLAIRTRTLGAEHPDTTAIRESLHRLPT